jgi:hypothetical protein
MLRRLSPVSIRRRALPVLALVVVLAACGGEQGQSASSAATTLDAGLVSVGASLSQMRGHLRVALELDALGDDDAVAVHTAHPTAELLEVIRADLHEAGADADALGTALQAAADAVGTDDAPTAIEAAIDAAGSAEEAVAGDLIDAPEYVGSVIATLLATVGHEYGEAVADGELQQETEFQDAYGFTLEARERYDAIASDVESASAEEAAEIDEAFETLGAALPGPEAPDSLADVEDVEAAAALVGHELEETVAALPVTDSDSAAVAEEINGQLDEILSLVEEGDRDAAAELAAEAYLTNYEVIEGAVIAAAPEINEELEPLLGADLRATITDGADLAEVEAMTDRARELLAEAVEALEDGETHE